LKGGGRQRRFAGGTLWGVKFAGRPSNEFGGGPQGMRGAGPAFSMPPRMADQIGSLDGRGGAAGR